MVQLSSNKPQSALTIATLALVGCGAALLVALSCDGSRPDRNTLRPPPASASARAWARAQRKARKLALEEQGPRRTGSYEDDVPDDLPDDGGIGDAQPDAIDGQAADDSDAGQLDASARPDGSDADAGVSVAALCTKLCRRAIACALEMMEDEVGPLDDTMRERMQARLRRNQAKCQNKCLQQLEKTPAEQKSASECLSRDSCKAFMRCMEDVMSSDG